MGDVEEYLTAQPGTPVRYIPKSKQLRQYEKKRSPPVHSVVSYVAKIDPVQDVRWPPGFASAPR